MKDGFEESALQCVPFLDLFTLTVFRNCKEFVCSSRTLMSKVFQFVFLWYLEHLYPGEETVLVAPLLDVHNIGVVHQAGRAVGRVGSPVQILRSIHD